MSWSDEEIDDLFRESSSRINVSPFQDSFFDEVAHLLPQKKTKKRGFWFLSSLLVLVTGGSIAAVVYLHEDQTLSGSGAKQFPSSVKAIQVPEKKAEMQAHEINSINAKKEHFYHTPKVFGSEESGLEEPTVITEQDAIRFKTEPVVLSAKTELLAQSDLVLADIGSGVKESFVQLTADSETKAAEIKTEKDSGIRKTTDQGSLQLAPLGIFLPLVEEQQYETQYSAFALAPRKKRHYIYLELGAGLSESYITNEAASGKAMQQFNAGVAYQYRKKMYSFDAGLQLIYLVPGQLSLNRESKVYGFDVDHYSQTMKYRSITSIELPVSITRNFNRQGISLGLSPTFMLGSTIDFSKSQNGIEIEHSSVYFNKIGLKTWGIKPQLAYQIRLTPGMEFGVKLSAQLISPIDNTKFVGRINASPFTGQITFRKYFGIK